MTMLTRCALLLTFTAPLMMVSAQQCVIGALNADVNQDPVCDKYTKHYLDAVVEVLNEEVCGHDDGDRRSLRGGPKEQDQDERRLDFCDTVCQQNCFLCSLYCGGHPSNNCRRRTPELFTAETHASIASAIRDDFIAQGFYKIKKSSDVMKGFLWAKRQDGCSDEEFACLKAMTKKTDLGTQAVELWVKEL